MKKLILRLIRNSWNSLITSSFRSPASEGQTTPEQTHYEEYPLRAGFARQYRFPN